MTPPTRVRTDQPTVTTLEHAMRNAVFWARRAFTDAGFTHVQLVVNVVATSLDPDNDTTRWAAGSRAPDDATIADRSLLARSLRQSADEVRP